jgi:hypothetical protein
VPASATPESVDPNARIRDIAAVNEAMRQAFRAALIEHYHAGVPVVVCVDGEPVKLPAAQLLAEHGWLEEVQRQMG